MASPITPFSIVNPGYYGLNTQDSPTGMDQGYALRANNCVIDRHGRLASRKGWVKAHTANSDLSTSNITCIGELVRNDGTTQLLATGGAFLFKHSSTTLTTLTYGGGGVAPTISASNWQFCQMNDIAMFWQRGYDPLIYDPAVSTTTFRRLSERSGAAGITTGGAAYQCNTAICAYGRVWAADTSADKNTVIWSDLLAPHIWTGGTSGSLNLIGIWPKGGDEIVALAAHNNFLFIFGKKQILIYSGANAPSTMLLSDSIIGVGCVARDSVQNCGDDVWFLSDSGVRSLERTIQEKSAPMSKLSRNVNTEIQGYVSGGNMDAVKSGYSQLDAIYIITFPSSSVSVCFDTRIRLPDGSARITMWNHLIPSAYCATIGRKFYFGQAGYIAEYSTYLDDGVAYRMEYLTPWIDFGDQIRESILKKITFTLITVSGQQLIIKWGFDFVSTQYSEVTSIGTVSDPALYAEGLYGVSLYGEGYGVATKSAVASGVGQVVQIGFVTDLADRLVSIQKIDVFTKNGKLSCRT